MNEEQMRARSAEKVQQIQGLLASLQMEAIPKQRLLQNGYLELVISFIDRENYPKEMSGPNAPASVEPQKDAENPVL